MFRLSLALSFLSAMFVPDLTQGVSSTTSLPESSAMRTQNIQPMELNEDQRIVIEARVKLGRELRRT